MSIQTGNFGEEKAANYLVEKGYTILQRNYRHKRNEIDLIVKKGQLLIFVEVKTKSNLTYGLPEETVDQSKADRIVEAAENYLFENDWQNDIRFDIISIVLKGKLVKEIKHFEDAFY